MDSSSWFSLKSLLLGMLRYSELVDSRSAALPFFPVADAVVLLSVRLFVPRASNRVTGTLPFDASSSGQ